MHLLVKQAVGGVAQSKGLHNIENIANNTAAVNTRNFRCERKPMHVHVAHLVLIRDDMMFSQRILQPRPYWAVIPHAYSAVGGVEFDSPFSL